MNRFLSLGLLVLTFAACERTTTEPVASRRLSLPPLLSLTGSVGGVERPITSDPARQVLPAIAGDRIVWADYRNGNADIYLLDLATGLERQITTDPATQEFPAISGDLIVWQDTRNGNFDVYLFDLASGTERQITTDPAPQVGTVISGDRIVWTDSRNGNKDIYVFDVATGTERQITTDPHDQFAPAISGDRIVWEDVRNGNEDIYLFDLAAGAERQITTDPHDQFAPAISGDRIVWQDIRSGIYYQIHLFDLATGTERQITTGPTPHVDPAISGDRIVWSDFRDGNENIYLFDLAAGTERQITTDPAIQRTPAIWGDRIVWEDFRDGHGLPFPQGDIYLFDLSPDVTPPSITPPPNLTVSTDPGQCSATVDPGTATATDDRPGVTVARSPAGFVFAHGATSVTWVATDAAGNTATALQTVTVPDAERPSLTPPVDVTAGNDPGQASATVNPGSATAADNCPGVVVLGVRSDGLALGAPYPVEVTRIMWTATDGDGNASSAEQRITVRDVEPPTVSVPGDFDVNATSPSGTEVLYPATARDNVGVVTFGCTPASGSVFAIGMRTVTCSAADAAGNSASASFLVTVKGAEEQITDLQGAVAGLTLLEGTETSLEQKLAAALESLADGQRTASCNQLQALINQVNAQTGKKITAADAAVLIREAERIRAVLAC